MRFKHRWVERSVRFLIGLPIAFSYRYVRHFHPKGAYFFLGMGLFLILTAVIGLCPVHSLFSHSSVEHPEVSA